MPDTRETAGGSATITQRSVLLFRQARRLAADYAQLAVLDACEAGVQLAWLLSIVVAVSVLVTTAWLACVVAVVVWLLAAGTSWPLALIIAALCNIVAGVGLLWWLRSRMTEWPFSATLRQLRGEHPAEHGT
jgi:hypothetical protein